MDTTVKSLHEVQVDMGIMEEARVGSNGGSRNREDGE